MAKGNPIRIGLVGLGRAGWGMHTRELEGKESKFRFVAACDLIPERCERMAGKYGCATYDRIEDLVADPNVEMVSVATRSVDHFEHTRLALKAGKHVFLEKPMTATYAEARKLQALAAKARGGLYVRHNRRFEEAFLHIREIIASGVLGEVQEVKLARVGYSRRDDWQTLKAFAGGQLLNWGPHIIDHACRLLESPVKTQFSDLKCIAAVGDAEDHLKITLVGENGRVVDVEISGGAAVGLPEYVIWGARGGLICRGNEIELRYINPRSKLAVRKPKPETPDASFGTPEKLKWVEKTLPVKPKKTYDIWDELFKAIRQGSAFPITLDEAVGNMKVVQTAKKGTEFV
ncbi:Gfo/Idh/MocA family oxidoreductase [bacterium]|nr:Gfo/Idh/MocA family oxidoreductase [bacterium]